MMHFLFDDAHCVQSTDKRTINFTLACLSSKIFIGHKTHRVYIKKVLVEFQEALY